MALKHMCTTYNPLAGDDPIFSQAISRNHGYQAILWSHLQPQVFEANFPRLRQTFAVLLAIFRRGWLTSVLRISSKRRQAEIELINRMTFAATDYAHGIIGGRKASAEFLSATGLFPSICSLVSTCSTGLHRIMLTPIHSAQVLSILEDENTIGINTTFF